jgi:O-antigen ligase
VKWLVFTIAVLASYPVGWWLRGRPSTRGFAWSLCGFLPFFRPLEMALVPFGGRPGDTYGLEVAVLDWLALSLFFAHRGPSRRVPNRVGLALYLLAALASVTQAEWMLGAFGYVWKLGRMYFLLAVICRAGEDRRVPAALLRGMMLGLVYECGWALWQHFGLGLPRATGTFAHQNTLGMMVNLVVMVPIALELAGRSTRLTRLAAIAAVPVSILTISRGALLFLAGGVVLVYVASAARTFTLRKARVGLVGLALAAAIAPFALAALGSRPASEQIESMETREQYERAASLMLAEHPLGIGPNHFTLMLMTGYGERAGVEWSQRVAIVHDVYSLTAAEMGYAGLLALAVLFLGPLVSAARALRQAGRDPRGDLLIGLAVALTLFYAHGFFEWAWRQTAVSYLYWMIVAVTESLSRRLLEERAARRRPLASPRGLHGAAAATAVVG